MEILLIWIWINGKMIIANNMNQLKIQFLHEELKRTCEWIKFADQKAAFIALYYSVLIGFLVSKKDIIVNDLKQLHLGQLFVLNSILFLLLVLLSLGIFYLFSCVFPQLKNHSNEKSLFYFGTVSKMKFLDFIKKIENLSEDETKEQIAEQIYTTSIIADQKMNNIQNSVRCLFASAFLILIMYVYFNL
ncbi:MAG: hypothetical protein US63_C0005G0022 [Candidatus Moranbacteria bacterium GW2011_GWC2_37_8]|nr:MAG: hypothetical protein US63_C0005G0022 [Candidatus Moranbacteria bacterium GW2011_GWC2_37_8]KKQ62625.1 MAG: hypothetical protein US82_C0008G0007 [Parcubacteria group bacterium GW2011_GWC1_38_22]KKQ79465.1 MAG: hypothetical protein UT03_C0053G0010 [Candidatus Moranbacteria bacterium GW2011_GWD2_38_7]